MPDSFFFFRPLLAADKSWAALDWRQSPDTATESAHYIECLNQAGVAQLAGSLPLVTAVTPELLAHHEFVSRFGTKQAVFILPASSLENATCVRHCGQLRREGYRIGLHIDAPDQLRKIPLNAFDYVQYDAAFARQEFTGFDQVYANDAGLHRLAANVGTYEMFDWLTGKGFEWCDSHFLTARNPRLGRDPDLTRLKLIKLLNIVKQDGDTREIETIFREEPKLSYNLLRLVNSVAVGAKAKISNFSQAITILGRRHLQRWLQLLIYADNLADGSAPNPLMQLAAARGRQMELLCASIFPGQPNEDPEGAAEFADHAFLTGLFSLLDVLINLPMTDILRELPLHEEVATALRNPNHDGVLGKLLASITAAEAGNFQAAQMLLTELGIDPLTHAKSQVTALHWAAHINTQVS
ncbi:EAL and HDOD domain-containing protein [Propionivibrio limicola]|uniref:EAL and HDOD domain-containing protein n=1 Tax=Propionivibrio limicola TaxID=167645 RepID=UPI001290B4E5|nr:HDOD domain-containing protein [Propionivibrio limicola]